MATTHIENVIVKTKIAPSLDLDKVHSLFPESQYDPSSFKGLFHNTTEPETGMILLPNGELVMTGPKSLNDVKTIIHDFMAALGKNGIMVHTTLDITIKNIVASHDFGRSMDLDMVRAALTDGTVKLDREKFDGIIYNRTSHPGTVLIFSSGKIVITDMNKTDGIRSIVGLISHQLTAAGIIGSP